MVFESYFKVSWYSNLFQPQVWYINLYPYYKRLVHVVGLIPIRLSSLRREAQAWRLILCFWSNSES
jgi:hypothetical protein